MLVKRYVAKTEREAIRKLELEMGADAYIISTRKIRQGGLFKYFKKPIYEVVGAVEVAEHKKSPTEDYHEIKHMLTSLMDKVDQLEYVQHESHGLSEETIEDAYVRYLVNMNVQPMIANKIVDIAKRQISFSNDHHETIINAMKVITRDYLGESKIIENDLETKPMVYLFVGPTGVGKTTTLAKIAANLILKKNKKVGLITTDTFRIAAADQLRTYAEILTTEIDVVYSSEELGAALERMSDMDYILVDTAGRSHKSKELRHDFEEISRYIKRMKVFLVLSLTTSYDDMKSIIASYGFLDDFRLLFTKMDEAVSYANILNMRVLTGKPLSYIATGQNVPDDIEVADKEKIIFNLYSEAIDGSGTEA